MNEDTRQALKEIGFPVVDGGFGSIIADPAWSFEDKGSRAAPDWSASEIYKTMSAEEILALPVDMIAAPSSHLYLWTTDVHLSLALNVMDAWGFVFKKSISWVKKGVSGKLQIGMGHYFRTAKELCLFGTRGKCPAAVHNLPDVFEAPRTQHSRKPDKIHEWAEQLSPGPRVELFARRSREGWEGWGDQFPGHDAYIRSLATIAAGRREARAQTVAKRSARAARMNWDRAQQGTSKWAARCAFCWGTIAQGDGCVYDPETNVKACHPCAVAEQQPT